MTDRHDDLHLVVPDFDGQLVHVVDQLVRALRRLDAADRLIGGLGSDALAAVRSAINGGERIQFRGPDQGHDHEPVTLVTIAASTLGVLTDLLEELRRVVIEAGYRVGVDEDLARSLEETGSGIDVDTALELVARIHGLLDLDNHLEVAVLSDAFERARSSLGGAELDQLQEAAYRRLRDRWLAMWDDRSPMEPWAS
ncbi:MAG: hypothetical protein ACK5LS_02630 [Propioniciclava sp.]